MSPIIPYVDVLSFPTVRLSTIATPEKSRAFSGTGDWSLDESDPDIATAICAYCKHVLHFSPTISRVSIEAEMAKHRRMYCHGESVR
jgi:hypothetical protein